jgi:hypothetical protein
MPRVSDRARHAWGLPVERERPQEKRRAFVQDAPRTIPIDQWVQSYATDDILYCVYRAPNEDVIREYARGSTLPVHRISEVRAKIDPTTIGDTERTEP